MEELLELGRQSITELYGLMKAAAPEIWEMTYRRVS